MIEGLVELLARLLLLMVSPVALAVVWGAGALAGAVLGALGCALLSRDKRNYGLKGR